MNPCGLIARAAGMALASLRALLATHKCQTIQLHAASINTCPSARPWAVQWVLLIARGDRAIYRKGFGFADVEKQTPYQPEFTQPVASISKMFTAFVALSLQSRRIAESARPVCKYFSPCPEAWRPMVLMHPCGIPRESPTTRSDW